MVDLPDRLLMPALVNAHTHLDLTHMGPRPFDRGAGFVGWIKEVIKGRRSEPDLIRESMRRGLELSALGGVAAVGDIVGAPATGPSEVGAEVCAHDGMAGRSFIEFFGIGKGAGRGLARAREALARVAPCASDRWEAGLSPHATNTVGAEMYRECLLEGEVAVATHVAESVDEREFIATGRGPQRELLERLGVWEDSVLSAIGRGLTPIEHIARLLDTPQCRARRAPVMLVHLNDCSDADLDRLASLRSSGVPLWVAYCPRGSSYFGAHEHFGPHRYREMSSRGIPVALGTDSIINLGPDSFKDGISTWGEMVHLHQRDGEDAVQLLRMATVTGACALGLDPNLFTFGRHGPIAGVLSVVVKGPFRTASQELSAVLSAVGTADGNSPQFLLNGNRSCQTAT